MKKNKIYDVIIIGAGTAGISARNQISKKTKNYLVVDAGPLGTTCARVGCMPSKVFIEAANLFHQKSKLKLIGVKGAEKLKLSDASFMKHVRSLRDRFVNGVLNEYKEWDSKSLLLGRARILNDRSINVDGQTYHAKRIIIATGSSPHLPEDWLPLRHELLNSDKIFELKKIPKSLAVIGAGALGLELAQAYSRIGTKVVVFGGGNTLGGLTQPDLINEAKKVLSTEFKMIQKKVTGIKKNSSTFTITVARTKSYKFDQVLIATGRKPNVENLGLENLGVALNENGLPQVNKETGRITGTRAYLAGDMNAKISVQHEAAFEGRVAGQNSVRNKDFRIQRKPRLTITFTSPNICIVGKSFAELTDRKNAKGLAKKFATGTVSFNSQGRSLTKFENKGMLKVFGEIKTGKILGAEIFAPAGEHLAHLLACAIHNKMTASTMLDLPYYHPVIEEGLRTALQNLAKNLQAK